MRDTSLRVIIGASNYKGVLSAKGPKFSNPFDAFKCPYCGKQYKAESMLHLLHYALKAEKSGAGVGKLKAYFEAK